MRIGIGIGFLKVCRAHFVAGATRGLDCLGAGTEGQWGLGGAHRKGKEKGKRKEGEMQVSCGKEVGDGSSKK